MSSRVLKNIKDAQKATVKNVQKTIRLTKENAKKVDKISKDSKISVNVIINGLIEHALWSCLQIRTLNWIRLELTF